MREPDLLVQGAAATAAEAVELAATDVDMAILDIKIDGCGLKAATQILRNKPKTQVIFLTASESYEDVQAALQLGAAGYMLKGIAPGTLVQTLRTIMAGETYIMPQLATRLLVSASQNRLATDQSTELLRTLTARERQILGEVRLGQTNKEIARKLGITEKTVKHLMGRVLQKLCVRNRTEAVVLTQKLGERTGAAALR